MRGRLRAAILAIAALLCSAASTMAAIPPIENVVEEQIPAVVAPLAGRLELSPYNFEFTGEDYLRLTVHNSQTGVVVGVHYRMQRPGEQTHPSVEHFTPATDRSASTTSFQIGRGRLLNVTVFAESGAPSRGQTFARLQVVRGQGDAAIVLGTIVQGYITGSQDRAWPGSPLEGSLEGDGYFRHVTGTDPAAGAEVSETVPTGARWYLTALRYTLVTSATVANRLPRLAIDDGTTQFLHVVPTQRQAASLSRPYNYLVGANGVGNDVQDQYELALPSGLYLPAGYRVRTASGDFQVDDNYSAPELHVREWLEAR